MRYWHGLGIELEPLEAPTLLPMSDELASADACPLTKLRYNQLNSVVKRFPNLDWIAYLAYLPTMNRSGEIPRYVSPRLSFRLCQCTDTLDSTAHSTTGILTPFSATNSSFCDLPMNRNPNLTSLLCHLD